VATYGFKDLQFCRELSRPADTGRAVLMPLKVSEIIKMIEADGWYLATTRGSHRQYKHPVKPGRVTVAG
jgi:hypothetical protein